VGGAYTFLHTTAFAPGMAAINTATVDIISFVCFIFTPFLSLKKTAKGIGGQGVNKSYT
jgi:hypothetical protein